MIFSGELELTQQSGSDREELWKTENIKKNIKSIKKVSCVSEVEQFECEGYDH